MRLLPTTSLRYRDDTSSCADTSRRSVAAARRDHRSAIDGHEDRRQTRRGIDTTTRLLHSHMRALMSWLLQRRRARCVIVDSLLDAATGVLMPLVLARV